jgi:glycosyltransferase involved in cell wall biosynthesis
MQQDLDVLKREFDVRFINFYVDPLDLKATCISFYNLITGIAWADVVFCWFAGSEAFFATAFSQVFHKKTAIVVGGGDVTSIPEIGYGAPLGPKGRFYTKFILNRATKVLPYSKDAEKNVRFLKRAGRVELVYLGIDTEKFCSSKTKRDEVITVSDVRRQTLRRKGLETFVKSAAYLPEVKFFLIGQFRDDSINYLRLIASKNDAINLR